MAYVMPSNPSELRLAGAPELELVTLEYLAEALPDDYTVFHAVHWAGMTPRQQRFGEIDFVVVNQSGDLLLIEQKNGALVEGDDALFKEYANTGDRKSVVGQLYRGRDGLLDALKTAGIDRPDVSVLVYCPDHRVKTVSAAGLSANGIVDAAERNTLAERIQKLLNPGVDRGDGRARAMRDFLSHALELEPDMGSTAALHERTFRRLSGGLHELLDGLEFEPWRLRVRAAAGAGKSLMAMRAYEQAKARGERPLLVCFNRPLADQFRAHLGEPEHVDTFHGLCRHWLDAHGDGFDKQRVQTDGANYWPEVVEQMAVIADKAGPYDTLIVDEGQDFEPEWWEVLKLAMKEGFRCLWLEDSDQSLYERDPVALDDFVVYKCRANFRTPVRIARYIDKLLGWEIDWRNPLPGMSPSVHTYESHEEQLEVLEARVAALLRVGFEPEQIAIVSVHGLARAMFADLDALGDHRLQRFTGRYTDDGEAVMTHGPLRAETLFRFKGQQAPAMILTDIDFDGEDEIRESHISYCGLTRATIRCELLVSSSAACADDLKRAAK